MSRLQVLHPSAWIRFVPGLVLCLALALVAGAIGQLDALQRHGFSALTVAIVLGMLAGNLLPGPVLARCGAGTRLAKQDLLRLGVVLYGLRLTVQDVGRVGATGVLIDTVMLASTFALACWIGIRWLGLDRRTAMLIGAGSSICGAAAVIATEPVVKARAEQVTVAVATVVVFGTLATFLYPILFALDPHWHQGPDAAGRFGLYAGSTIHEVAQVLAAARSVDPAAADTAVITKMVRVMMLAPFLLGLSAWLARADGRASGERAPIAVPRFAFAFVGVVLVNSLHVVPPALVAVLNSADTLLLATAMAALGVATHVGEIRKAGARPLLLALALFAWLVVGGALVNRWLPAALAWF